MYIVHKEHFTPTGRRESGMMGKGRTPSVGGSWHEASSALRPSLSSSADAPAHVRLSIPEALSATVSGAVGILALTVIPQMREVPHADVGYGFRWAIAPVAGGDLTKETKRIS